MYQTRVQNKNQKKNLSGNLHMLCVVIVVIRKKTKHDTTKNKPSFLKRRKKWSRFTIERKKK